jgi:hypothetical protein
MDMTTVLEALAQRGGPTDEEFVSAVIKTHERIRSELQAMLRGTAPRTTGEGSADAETIWDYNLSHDVDPGTVTEFRRADPRWMAASAR